MNTSQRPDSSGPGGFLPALRGRWQIAPGLAALGLLAAAAYVLVIPKVYTATASVRPAATPNSGFNVLPYRVPDLRGDAQAARSAGVAAIAGQMLHSSMSALALSNKVTVTVPPGSGALDIACTASSASSAARCANAFAAAYLKDRSASAALSQQITLLKTELSSVQKAVARLTTKISGLPSNSAEKAAAQAQLLHSDQSQLSSLNGQLTVLYGQAAQTSGGTVITAASPPRQPTSPGKTLVLTSGLAAGLFLGLIVEFWVDRRDKRIWSAVVR